VLIKGRANGGVLCLLAPRFHACTEAGVSERSRDGICSDSSYIVTLACNR
jgi:hypothetical protein